jgi:hypothetical protein
MVMRRFGRISVTAMLILAIAACVQTRAEPEGRLPSNTQENRVPGEYLVGLVAGSDPAAARKLFAAYGVAEWRHIRKDTYLVRLQDDPGAEAMARLVQDATAVRYVEPNRVYTTQ